MAASRPYPCPNTGCHQAFSNAISLGSHSKRCTHRVIGILKRQAEVEAAFAAAKRARLDVLDEGPGGDWEDIEDVGGVNEVRFFSLFNVPERAYTHLLGVQVAHPSPPPVNPAPPSPPAMSTRGGRALRIPKKYEDMVPLSRNALPSQFAPLFPPSPPIPQVSPPCPPPSSVSSEGEDNEFESTPDAFGIFRQYFRKPERVPEEDGFLEDVCDAPGLEGSNATKTAGYDSIYWLSRNVAVGVDSENSDYGPFANASQFRLFDYFYDRSEVRSHDAFDDLLHVLRSEAFSVDDLEGFSARKGDRALEDWVGRSGSVFSKEDGWLHSSVRIPLPPRNETQTPPRIPPPPLRSPASYTEVSVRSSRPPCRIQLHVARRIITGCLMRCTGYHLTLRRPRHPPHLPRRHHILRCHAPHPSACTRTVTTRTRCWMQMPKCARNLDTKMTTMTSSRLSSHYSSGRTPPTSQVSARLCSGQYTFTSGISRSTFEGVRPSSPPTISPTYLTLVSCICVLSIAVTHDLTVA